MKREDVSAAPFGLPNEGLANATLQSPRFYHNLGGAGARTRHYAAGEAAGPPQSVEIRGALSAKTHLDVAAVWPPWQGYGRARQV